MTGPFFIDTNILVYADDRHDTRKQAVAQELVRSALRSRLAHVSTQVLCEFFTVAIRKLDLSAASARRRVEIYSSLSVFQISPEDVVGAIDLHRLHSLSFWDSLIVRAAQASGCQRLFSEDLQHGQRFDGLEIVDPFRAEET